MDNTVHRPQLLLYAARPLVAGVLLGLGFPSEYSSAASLIVSISAMVLFLAGMRSRTWLASNFMGLTLGNLTVLAWLPSSMASRLPTVRAWEAWLFLAVYGALFPLLALAGARWLRRRGQPWIIGLVAFWVAGEGLRAHLFSGYDWLALGYVSVDSATARLLLSCIGVHGLSGVMIATAAIVIDVIEIGRRRGWSPQYRFAIISSAIGIICAAAWSSSRFADVRNVSEEHRTLRVGVLQARHTEPNWSFALDGPLSEKADFIVGPEGVLGTLAPVPGLGSELLMGAQSDCGRLGARRCVQNTVLHFSPEGRIIDRYAKRVLVPLYEGDFAGIEADTSVVMTPGRVPGVFPVAGTRIGVLICYEVSDVDTALDLVEAGAEFIAVPTSDTWQVGSAAARQHLNVLRVRAAELGMPMLRVSNQQLTALADGSGETIPLLASFQSPAATTVPVNARRSKSFYATHWRTIHEAELAAPLLPIGIAILGGLARRRRIAHADIRTV